MREKTKRNTKLKISLCLLLLALGTLGLQYVDSIIGNHQNKLFEKDNETTQCILFAIDSNIGRDSAAKNQFVRDVQQHSKEKEELINDQFIKGLGT